MPEVHPTADVHPTAVLGVKTVVWQYVQVREAALLGAECSVGRGAYIGAGVTLGDRCKVQNAALIYEPARLGDGVFVGPAVVLTNDRHPRAVTSQGQRKSAANWTAVGVTVGEGASLGAHCTVVGPAHVGRWSLVGAGATVVADVPDFALVVGTPARQLGWVGKAGGRLTDVGNGRFLCPITGERFELGLSGLREIGMANGGNA